MTDAIVILLCPYLVARAFVGGRFVNATFAGVSHASVRDQVSMRYPDAAPERAG